MQSYVCTTSSYIIVQMLSSGFKHRPSLPPRQGVTPPFYSCGLAGLPQPGLQHSPPSQLLTPESQAELRSTGEGDSEGKGKTRDRSLSILYSLAHSVTSSLTLPPFLLVHLSYSNSLVKFTLFSVSFCSQAQFLYDLLNSYLTAHPQQNLHCSIQPKRINIWQ